MAAPAGGNAGRYQLSKHLNIYCYICAFSIYWMFKCSVNIHCRPMWCDRPGTTKHRGPKKSTPLCAHWARSKGKKTRSDTFWLGELTVCVCVFETMRACLCITNKYLHQPHMLHIASWRTNPSVLRFRSRWSLWAMSTARTQSSAGRHHLSLRKFSAMRLRKNWNSN